MRAIPIARPLEVDRRRTTSPEDRRPPPKTLDPLAACSLLRAHPRGGTQFWAAVGGIGTPLVDELPGDPTHRAVTFVHKAAVGVDSVDVLVRSIVEPERFETAAMRLLPASDVWATTFRLDARRRGSYSLAAGSATSPPAPVDEGTRTRLLDGADPALRPSIERYLQASAIARPDPFATHCRPSGTSVMSLPDAPPVQWLSDLHEPAGVHHHTLGDGREVWRYEVAGLDPAQPGPLVVFLDGEDWSVDGPATITGMTAAGLLPPLLAVGVSSRDQPTRWSDLCCSEKFVRYLAGDVLGWAAQGRAITDDPSRTVIIGQSLGGLAGLFATQYLPERFGCVVAQSGSFWWPGPQEWLTEVVRAIDEPTHGVYLSIGTDEIASMTGSVARMAAALTERGDPLDVREFVGGHDPACWRADLADGLRAITTRW